MRREPAGRLHAGLTELTGPVDLCGRRAPSRVLFGPHETNLGDGRSFSARHVAYYARRAAGGAGVIVTEVASVHVSDHPYAYAPGFWAAAAGWSAIADACRPHGTLVLAGLGHAGGQGSTVHTRTPLWGPSRVPDVVSREVPVPLDGPGIAALLDGFAVAARAAVAAGLDGVEVNAGQHSLLRQFCSGLTNVRDDSYGADRGLLLREVLSAVRSALGPDHVLGLRLCVDELAPWAGITVSDGVALAASVAASVDYLVPVRGCALSLGATRPDMHTPPGVNRDVCRDVRSGVVRPAVVWQGSVVDPLAAAHAVADGTADLVEMTRAQIADPDLVRLVRAGTPERVRPCSLSNQGAARDPRNPVVSDEMEPRSGHETTDPPVDGTDPVSRDVLVVGGGPAGCEAARTLALRGHRATLHERASRLGGALRLAAVLPGRQRWDLLADWWAAELDRLGVDVRLGSEISDDDLRAAEARGAAVLLATGSGPPESGVPGPVVGAAEWCAAIPAARSVVVVDPVGDATGPGIAELVAASGARTTLVTPDAVAGDQLGRTGGLADANARLDRAGVERAVFTRLESVADGRATLVDVHTGASRTVPCDLVIDCSARLPDDPLWTVDPRRVRAGDCVAPRTVAEAVREGRRAALAIGRADFHAPRAIDGARTGEVARDPSDSLGRSSGGGGVGVSWGIARDPSVFPEPSSRDRGSGDVDRRTARDPSEIPGSSPGPARLRSERIGDEVTGAGVPTLHSPLRVGPVELRNRVVFTAHLTGFAEHGLPTARHAAYYAARAEGGAGMVITEEHSVLPGDRPYENVIRGHDPAASSGRREIADAVHAHGAVVLAQLNHNGGQSSGMYAREPVVAPSALPDPMFREVAVALTERGIAEVVDGYARTAALCVADGFDGVELQCSHASLLRMFLSPATNRRTDGWGGSTAKRARIVVDVVAAVRAAIGPDRVLGVRLGADERIPGGLGLADGVEHARLLESTGHVDYLSTSIGVATASLHLIEASMHTPPGYAAFIPSALRRAVSLPVLGVGRFTTPEQAEATLAAGECDLVGVARGQIADPDFATKAADGRSVRRCVGCNQECVGRVGLNAPLGCVVNPRAGREWLPAPTPVRRGLRVAVVGGGPAGLAAAAGLARRGHRVTLVERGERTGGQVALAALAPGRAELGHVVDDLAAECVAAGVQISSGVDVLSLDDLVGSGTEPHPGSLRGGRPATGNGSEPDAIVLATGSAPSAPPWARPGVVSVHDVLSGAVAPTGRVLVVDELGFHQATSTAELLAARGCTVEVVTPALVVGQDLGVTLDREGFRRRAHAAGIATATDRVVTGVAGRAGALEVTLLHHPTGAHERRRVDAVVHALSTVPRARLWTVLRDGPVPVFRIGDCMAPRRIDAAVREGERVASEIDAAAAPAGGWVPCCSAT